MGLRWKADMTQDDWWSLMRWRLARETGWPLEYIDELSFDDIREHLSVSDGEAKASPGWNG